MQKEDMYVEHVYCWTKQRILFNEEETIKMIRKLAGVSKLSNTKVTDPCLALFRLFYKG